MPRWIDNLAIDRKLMLIMMLTVVPSLVAACLSFVLTDALATYRSAKLELSTFGDIVANNSVSALAFDDAVVAEETLHSLAANEGIVSGCLWGQDGALLAQHPPDGSAACDYPEQSAREPWLEDGRLVSLTPVIFQDERLGTLVLRSDLSRLRARLLPYAVGTLLAVAISSLLALVLSSRLKNFVTAPILRLADAVREVSRSQRYSARVHGAGQDEIGLLMKGFNEMLEQIQIRDGELRKAHDELEQRVVERTAELEVARDAAQAASRAKSEFLANMSHEIRTPLNSVMGLTEVVLNTKLDASQRDFLATIRESAESLLSVLNDILDFSKIEAGKLDMERVRFSIHDTVDDTLTALALRAEVKQIEMACYVDPSLPGNVVGDPGRLRQVISNLVSNAIKFTDRGEVVVRVEPEGWSDESLLVHFSVRDTGIGIPAAHLDRLFEPFEQADTSTTRRFGGTGLGLSISRQLVEMMGGTIGVESVEGRGSTFSFTARFEVPEGVRLRQQREPFPLEGVRVLIVDDNATNRTILGELTRAVHMRPLSARSADEALQLLRLSLASDDPVQLVLSDVHMPEVDGYGLAEQIRADQRLRGLTLIFLTSAGQAGDLERCEQLGIAARLVKPVRQSELFQVMERSLGVERQQAPGAVVRSARRRDERSDVELPPLRILLVDDSEANRKVALAMLAGGGHGVQVAENGRVALERLDRESFDVVLMDVQMPQMDGFEATAAIRAREGESGAHLPIVALTAHALQGDREKCLAAGMDDYVSKPIRRAALHEALARVTSGRAAAGSASPPPVPAESPVAGPVRWSGLVSQVGDDVAVLREIVDAYLGEIRTGAEALPRLIETGPASEVRRLAHTLKGSMRTFGAAEAESHALALERLATDGDLKGARELLPKLLRAVDAVVPELTAFLASGRLPG